MNIGLSEFDIESWLDDHKIYYSENSKNVSNKYIGIDCPWCEDDTTQHMGIHRKNKSINCWRCGKKGTVLKLVMKTQRVDLNEAIKITRAYGGDASVDITKRNNNSIPEIIYTEISPIHQQFMNHREFDIQKIIREFKIKFTGPTSPYPNSIVAPVYYHGRIVTFNTRSCDSTASIKYHALDNDKSIIPLKDTLYNLDNTNKHTVIVCEGITDVWRIGHGSVCLFGKTASENQLRLLNKFKRIIVLLDSDAIKESRKLISQLSPTVKSELYILTDGDPSNLSDKDAKGLRKEIFGKYY